MRRFCHPTQGPARCTALLSRTLEGQRGRRRTLRTCRPARLLSMRLLVADVLPAPRAVPDPLDLAEVAQVGQVLEDRGDVTDVAQHDPGAALHRAVPGDPRERVVAPTSQCPSSSYRLPGLMSRWPIYSVASRASVVAISRSASTTSSRDLPSSAFRIGAAIGIASQGRSVDVGRTGSSPSPARASGFVGIPSLPRVGRARHARRP